MRKLSTILLSGLLMLTSVTACTSQAEKDRQEDRKKSEEFNKKFTDDSRYK